MSRYRSRSLIPRPIRRISSSVASIPRTVCYASGVPTVRDRVDETEHGLVRRPRIVDQAALDALPVEAEDPSRGDRVEAVLVAQFVRVDDDVRVVVHHLRPERARGLVLRTAGLVAIPGGVRPSAANRAVEASRVAREDVQELREVKVLARFPLHILPVVSGPKVPFVDLRWNLHRALFVEVGAALLVLRERLLVEHLDGLATQAREIHRAEDGDRLELLCPADAAEAATSRHPLLECDAREPHEVLARLSDAERAACVFQFLPRLFRIQAPEMRGVLQFRLSVSDLDSNRRV